MGLLVAAMKELGVNLRASTEEIVRNLKLDPLTQYNEQIGQIGYLITSINEELVGEHLDRNSLRDSLKDFVDMLCGILKKDEGVNLTLTYSVNTAITNSLHLVAKINLALDYLDDEAALLKAVVKEWEIDPPASPLLDRARFKNNLSELSSANLKESLTTYCRKINLVKFMELAYRVDEKTMFLNLGKSLSTLKDLSEEIYITMNRLNERIGEEMIGVVEAFGLNLVKESNFTQEINLSSYENSVMNQKSTSAKIRKDIALYHQAYQEVLGELSETDSRSGVALIQTEILERIKYSEYMVTCLEQLDVFLDKNRDIVSANLKKLITMKKSRAKLFEEMAPILTTVDLRLAS